MPWGRLFVASHFDSRYQSGDALCAAFLSNHVGTILKEKKKEVKRKEVTEGCRCENEYSLILAPLPSNRGRPHRLAVRAGHVRRAAGGARRRGAEPRGVRRGHRVRKCIFRNERAFFVAKFTNLFSTAYGVWTARKLSEKNMRRALSGDDRTAFPKRFPCKYERLLRIALFG